MKSGLSDNLDPGLPSCRVTDVSNALRLPEVISKFIGLSWTACNSPRELTRLARLDYKD